MADPGLLNTLNVGGSGVVEPAPAPAPAPSPAPVPVPVPVPELVASALAGLDAASAAAFTSPANVK